jgi:hypothetical protein
MKRKEGRKGDTITCRTAVVAVAKFLAPSAVLSTSLIGGNAETRNKVRKEG